MLRNARRERGSILISGILSLVVISGLAVALFTTVSVEESRSRMNESQVTGRFLADGGAEICEKLILKSLSNNDPVSLEGSFEIKGHDVDYDLEVAGDRWVDTDSDGIHTLVQPILVNTSSEIDGYAERVHRILMVGQTPIFQFAVFYDKDLEILPGPDMTLRGRVHTNRDLYIGSGGTLTIDANYLRTVGDIYRHRKNDGSLGGGTVDVRIRGNDDQSARMDSWFQLNEIGIPSTSGFDSNFGGYDRNGDGDYIDPGEYSPWVVEAMERWGGTVQTAEHGMRELVAPSINSIQRFEEAPDGRGNWSYDENSGEYTRGEDGTGTHWEGYFHRKADLVILDGKAYDGDGQEIELPEGALVEKSFYDAREKKNVTVTEVDMALLGDSGYWPRNGLLYAARGDASSAQPNGIRLANGKELAGKLTVVSEGPVYTRGHYNSTNKKPASVICDAFNVQSESWDDTKGPGQLPTASRTAIAAAIITGSYDTTSGNYNGGFENLVRFHEKWDGIECIIRGSFVNIYDSQIATGQWSYGGDVYTAPVRNWDFDPDFNSVDKLPPFTPMVNHVKAVAWYDRPSVDPQ